MKPPSQMSRTAILVEGALMIALAFALSCLPGIEMPLGGKITLFSTLPIVIFSLRHSWQWGVGTAFVYSVTQFFQGMGNLSYLHTLWAMVLCVFLDYILAYTVLGLAGPIARSFKNRTLGLVVGILSTGVIRFACSFVSGILIWPPAAGTPAAIHSLLYNGAWCGPDVAILLASALLLRPVKALYLGEKMPRKATAGQPAHI